jgi:Ca2+-binding RTX toxin-like protein
MYQIFLGRAGAPEEISAGASSLQTASRQDLAAQILGSAEYFIRAGDANAAWVTRVYQDVLHREATTGEAGALLGALSAGQTREAAALEILTSREALTNVVRGAYQRFLNREASPGEVDFFVNRLSDERLAATLVGSSEYFDAVAASDEIVARAGTAAIETGDGRSVAGALTRTGASTFRVTGDLNYDAAGTYDLGITVFDGANVVVGATTAEIRAELGVNLVPDATDPTKTELRVVGTSADDRIALDRPGGAAIRVVLNGVPAGLFSPTGRIVVDALGGSDTVNISSTISRRSWVYGGSGDDVVNAASSGGNLLLGGDGNDRLSGGAGRDLLIGGTGVDVLGGSGGDDILIGGLTTLDGETAALAAVMAEWSSTNSYAVKVDNLTRFFQPGTTVPNDGEADELRGARARDWFLASVNDFTDVGSGETVTLIP